MNKNSKGFSSIIIIFVAILVVGSVFYWRRDKFTKNDSTKETITIVPSSTQEPLNVFEKTNSAKWITYSNPAVDFQFRYPENMIVTEGGEGYVVVNLSFNNGNPFIEFWPKNSLDTSEPQDHTKKLLTVKSFPKSSKKLGGYDTFLQIDQKFPLLKTYWVVKGDDYYSIDVNSDVNSEHLQISKEQFNSLSDKILSTFRFTN